MLCGAGEGGGGGGSNSSDYKYAEQKFKSWVADNPTDTTRIYAFVTFTTEFNQYITNMTFGTPSACSKCPSNITYQHGQNTGTLSTSYTSATTTVTGQLTNSDDPGASRLIDKTKNWTISEI